MLLEKLTEEEWE